MWTVRNIDIILISVAIALILTGFICLYLAFCGVIDATHFVEQNVEFIDR
jgi:hypothetical protein